MPTCSRAIKKIRTSLYEMLSNFIDNKNDANNDCINVMMREFNLTFDQESGFPWLE